MKKFIYHILLFTVIFVIINAVLLFAIPKDRNSYLCEYNHKLQLLETVEQPRIIIIGGSNAAFSIDSEILEDSLQYNIVNFGLHAGIGIRYPFEDCLDYIRSNDILVIQFEYENFYNGGNGEPETFLPFMIATDWRHCNKLNKYQLINIIKGIPATAFMNLKRLLKYPIIHSLDTQSSASKFRYTASGFNKYGDEISHFNFPNKPIPKSNIGNMQLSKQFINWFSGMLKRCELIGAKTIVLPPVCTESFFKNSDIESVSAILEQIGYPYAVQPSTMVLDDKYAFDTRYHMNRDGCILNTQNLIECITPIIHSDIR